MCPKCHVRFLIWFFCVLAAAAPEKEGNNGPQA